MAVLKTFYCCQNCGAQHSKWLGQCSSCKEWNTLVEEVTKKSSKVNLGLNSVQLKSKAQLVNEIDFEKDPRLLVEDKELNRVLGGGIVPGSLVLIGGEPGIGKSTLLLQISLEIKNKVLYITGEESQQQIRRRANRINNDSNQCYVLNETNVETIISQINTIKPELVIIDSIQTLQTDIIDSSPGSVSQIKESASQFLNYSKKTNLPIFLVGHITKDGGIAGPKILEHMVDVVLQFEGDRNNIYRILRAKKNRFGSTAEIGIYEMLNSGLRQVTNPSELLISNNKTPLSGNAIASTMEGIRAILIEVQALVSSAVYGTPQRSTTGFNAKRLNMLLAVLEKRAGFKLSSKDVFLNITGGIKNRRPCNGFSCSSSYSFCNFNIPLQKRICFAAEIGLSGELRSVPKIDQRISEAEKLGFEILIVSEAAKISFVPKKLKIISYSRIEDLIKNLFKEQG